MQPLELLSKSCRRLPDLVEMGAPSCILTAEIRHLLDLAFAALANQQHNEFAKRLEEWRAEKADDLQTLAKASYTLSPEAREKIKRNCDGLRRSQESQVPFRGPNQAAKAPEEE